MLPDGALHLTGHTGLYDEDDGLAFVKKRRLIKVCKLASNQYLLFYRLILFVIRSEVYQDGPLAGTVECQIGVATCTEKKPNKDCLL